MKILVLGDIHGRSIYRDIIEKESPDQVIFLGDFASSHHNISPEKQIEEFDWVINYKQQHPNTIILRGNHDTEAMGYYWAECYPKAYGYDMWADAGVEEFYNVGGNIFYNNIGDGMRVHNKAPNIPADAIMIYDNASKTWIYNSGEGYHK